MVRIVSFVVAVALALVAHADTQPWAKTSGNPVVTKSGLKYWDLKKGGGPVAAPGDIVSVLYTGWLSDGTKFDSSADHGNEPLRVWLGRHQVIAGWDEGLVGMQIGGKRQLHIPAKLAYGDKGQGTIPPNADLVFDVEVVRIAK